MNNIDPRGILVGGVLGIIAMLLIVVMYALLKVALFGESTGEYLLPELVAMLLLGTVSLAANGYLVARFSRRGKILNPILWGMLLIVVDLLPWGQDVQFPLWYEIVSATIIIPLVYLGAWIHVRQPSIRSG